MLAIRHGYELVTDLCPTCPRRQGAPQRAPLHFEILIARRVGAAPDRGVGCVGLETRKHMTNIKTTALLGLAIAAALACAGPARADTKCTLDFHLEGWSAFYKTAHGGGEVTCDNGQTARIAIRTKGGGVTFGAEKIVNGYGEFSPVSDIGELYGDYANAEAHAGMGESSDAQVVTKGTVSLAFSGKGHGVNLGFAFGKFTISHAPTRRHVEHRVEERRVEPPPVEQRPLEEDLDEHEPAPAPAHEGY